jgi:hypothetical protein
MFDRGVENLVATVDQSANRRHNFHMRLNSEPLQLSTVSVANVVPGETDRQVVWQDHQRYVAIRALCRCR